MSLKAVRQPLEGSGGGFVFPGPNRALGGAGPGPEARPVLSSP